MGTQTRKLLPDQLNSFLQKNELEPLVSKWLELKGESNQFADDFKQNVIYLKTFNEDFFILLLLKGSDYDQILFTHRTKLTYNDTETVLTLYELTLNVQIKDPPQLNLYRLINNRIILTTFSQISSIETNPLHTSLKIFANTLAEVDVNYIREGENLYLKVTDRNNNTLVNFSTIESITDPLKRLTHLCNLYESATNDRPNMKSYAIDYMKELLIELSLLKSDSPEVLKTIKAIQNDFSLRSAIAELQASLSSSETDPNLKQILNIILDESNPANALAKSNARRREKAREENYPWAYDLPHLIDRLAEEFCEENGLKTNTQQRIKGSFIELDLDPATVHTLPSGQIDYNNTQLIPAKDKNNEPRHSGENQAGVVIGIKENDLNIGIAVRRLLIIGDLTYKNKGALGSQECARINAAIRYAVEEKIPIDWFSAAYGVAITQTEGVENLTASAAVVREIIKTISTHGIAINIIVDHPSIGAQAYWNSLAAIYANTPGVLLMTSRGTMVLTGHRALTIAIQSRLHSLDIHAAADKFYPEGLKSLGGYANVFGPNGEAMGEGSDFNTACKLLLAHHYYSYITGDLPIVSPRPLQVSGASKTSTSKLNEQLNDPKMRYRADRTVLLEALRDVGSPKAISWSKDIQGPMIGREYFINGSMPQQPTTLVQEMLIGLQPTMVVFPPSGPLTPTDSYMIARAIYKAKGRLPVLLLLNLTGFNSDPLSMQQHQLSAGALIPQSIVEHGGPITIVNIGSLIGGTFVVFSKELSPFLRIIALEGSSAQVVGGTVAAKVIFHGRIKNEAHLDPRIINILGKKEQINKNPIIEAEGKNPQKMREPKKVNDLSDVNPEYNKVLREVIVEIEERESLKYNAQHDAVRALKVGSIDQIVSPGELKEAIIQMQNKTIQEFKKLQHQNSIHK